MDGFRAGRNWIAESAAVHLDFTAAAAGRAWEFATIILPALRAESGVPLARPVIAAALTFDHLQWTDQHRGRYRVVISAATTPGPQWTTRA